MRLSGKYNPIFKDYDFPYETVVVGSKMLVFSNEEQTTHCQGGIGAGGSRFAVRLCFLLLKVKFSSQTCGFPANTQRSESVCLFLRTEMQSDSKSIFPQEALWYAATCLCL